MAPLEADQDEVLAAETPQRLVCEHHWVLDRPNGPISKGACRRCGDERTFQN